MGLSHQVSFTLINERNKFDLEIYKFAQDRLRESISTHGNSFRKKLRNYEFISKLYNNMHKFNEELRISRFKEIIKFGRL